MYYVELIIFAQALCAFYMSLGNLMGMFFNFARRHRDYTLQLGYELTIRRWLFGFDWWDESDHFMVVIYFFGLHIHLSAFPKESSQ